MNVIPRPRALLNSRFPALRPALMWGNAALYLAQSLIWVLYPTTPHVQSEVWSLLAAFLHAGAFAAVTALLLLHGCTAVRQVEGTSIRLAMRMRKLKELKYTMGICTALFVLRVAAITAAAIVSVAAPDALDQDIGAGDSLLMSAYYTLTEIAPILLVLAFQRHIPPTAPLSASSAYRVVHGRDDSALVSSDTSSALRPSFDPNMSLLSDSAGPSPKARPTNYGSNAASSSVAITIPVQLPTGGAGRVEGGPASAPSTPKSSSSFISSQAAMMSTGTTKQVRMFGNIKQPKHVSASASLRLTDHSPAGKSSSDAERAAVTALATPVKASPMKSAIPSIGTALANRHPSQRDVFQPSRPAQWTAAGQVLLTWKAPSGQTARRRNWRQQSAVTRTLTQFGSSLSVALGLSPQPVDSTRSRLLPRSQSPSIQGEHSASRAGTGPGHAVALSIPQATFDSPGGPYASLAPSSAQSDDGFSLKDISPIKARALEYKFRY